MSFEFSFLNSFMGGVITRTMAVPNEPWTFLTNDTYGHGPIEKLVTISAPHLGSPLAADLLPTSSGQDPNSCMRRVLAKNNKVALQLASVDGNGVNGGANDLEGDGQHTASLSLALQSLQTYQSAQPFPMAYIGGSTESPNLSGLGCTFCKAFLLRNVCGNAVTNNPLALALTPQKWNSVFGLSANDGVVPLTSQVNMTTGGITFSGYVHSPGLIEGLDFVGPSLLDEGVVPTAAVDLLNEPKTGSDFQ